MKAIPLLLLCACATVGKGDGAAPESAPRGLAVPAGNTEKLSARGAGVQIYACKDAAWTLKAPEADLTDEFGGKAGRHYAGPTWEAVDGSKVVGAKVQEQPSPDSIPWLLLKAKSNEGAGLFSKITFIQRLDTTGGRAPAGPCEAGQERRVDYTATYRFFGP